MICSQTIQNDFQILRANLIPTLKQCSIPEADIYMYMFSYYFLVRGHHIETHQKRSVRLTPNKKLLFNDQKDLTCH